MELSGIACSNVKAVIGARATQAEVLGHEGLLRRFPLLAGEGVHLSDPIVRNCGTFVGALTEADPASDWTAIALVLGAEVHVRAAAGARTIPIATFLQGAGRTSLNLGELVTQIDLPVRDPRARMAYVKIPHPASGFALVGVAVAVDLDADGACADCRIAVTGAAPRAFRLRPAEQALRELGLAPNAIREASALGVEEDDVLGDRGAGSEYRKALVRSSLRRALVEAMSPLH